MVIPNPDMSSVHWASTSKELPVRDSQLCDSTEFDLAVVGAGFCGLSVALGAAKEGMSVLLLDAGAVGCGASGRNGGIVVPHFPGALLPSQVKKIVGPHRAERLMQLVENGPTYVFRQAEEYGIQCDAKQGGWIQPAHSEKSLGLVRKIFDEWKAQGRKAEWLDREAIGDATGATGYLGGWKDKTGGIVNPYALSQGLARVVQQYGGTLKQNCCVHTISRNGSAYVLSTQHDEYHARKVAITTNAYTTDLYPELSRSIIPVRLFHAFTRPLSEEERQVVLPRNISFTDLRKSGGFARLDESNRLLTGGAVLTIGNSKSYSLQHGKRRIAELFPQLKGIEIESYWEGHCALSPTFLPAIHKLDKDVYSVLGFSTRGVALTQSLGQELGRFLAESMPEADLPFGPTPVKSLPFQRTKKFLGGLVFPFYQARDALGLS